MHPNKTQIEKDILSGMGYLAVSEKYDNVSLQSVRTHKNKCIPRQIAESKNGRKIIKFEAKKEEIKDVTGINIAVDLLAMRNIVSDILDKFRNIEEGLEKIENPVDAARIALIKSDTLLKAIDRMVKVLDLYARVQGEVESEKHLHIHNNPDVMTLVTGIYAALQPYPDALRAVMAKVEAIA